MCLCISLKVSIVVLGDSPVALCCVRMRIPLTQSVLGTESDRCVESSPLLNVIAIFNAQCHDFVLEQRCETVVTCKARVCTVKCFKAIARSYHFRSAALAQSCGARHYGKCSFLCEIRTERM